jgi:hypothetical protein
MQPIHRQSFGLYLKGALQQFVDSQQAARQFQAYEGVLI